MLVGFMGPMVALMSNRLIACGLLFIFIVGTHHATLKVQLAKVPQPQTANRLR
jgi:hypothetical protein